MPTIKIQFVTMLCGQGNEAVAPLGPKTNGVFDTEADAEQAIRKYLEIYYESPCPLTVRKQFVKE